MQQEDSNPTSAWRWPLAIAATLVLGAVIMAAWYALHRHEVNHSAQYIERESYATRSDLVRELDRQFQALRSVARFWSDYGHLTPDQWDQDARIEIGHFEGFERLVWTDPTRSVRYATTLVEGASWDHRPDEQEWHELQPVLAGTDAGAGEALLPPVRGDDGHERYRVQIPATGPASSGLLVALIDADRQLEQVLRDHSPGFAIDVLWNDNLLYARDVAATDLPDNWTAGGLVALSVGPMWQVNHAPTANLAAELTRPTIPGLLAAGWIIAGLFGALLYQNGRIRDRALAAERAERRYAALNAELEDRVDERTADLETISQSISHDVRNALSTVATTGQFLRHARSVEDLPERADRIRAAVGETVAVLDRLQTYTSVTFSNLDRDLVDMRQLAIDVHRELATDWCGKFEVGDLPPCQAQAVLVGILFHNLLGNAIKFTRHREDAEIIVGADTDTTPTVYWIRDNGRGFDNTAGAELFKPFRQLANGIGEGRGLGLAIVARIVRRHGGRIWAEAQPERGATFRFDLGQQSAFDST